MHTIMVPTGNIDNGMLSGTNTTGNSGTQEDVLHESRKEAYILSPGLPVSHDPKDV